MTVTGPADDIKKFINASMGHTAIAWGASASEERAVSESSPSYFCFNALVPVPDEVIARGYDAGDPVDGYHWCRENWGCKWDVYLDKITPERMGYREGCESLEFSFDTADVPPKSWLVEAVWKFPSLDFQMEYREPDCLIGGCLYGGGGCIQDVPVAREELLKELWGEDESEEPRHKANDTVISDHIPN